MIVSPTTSHDTTLSHLIPQTDMMQPVSTRRLTSLYLTNSILIRHSNVPYRLKMMIVRSFVDEKKSFDLKIYEGFVQLLYHCL